MNRKLELLAASQKVYRVFREKGVLVSKEQGFALAELGEILGEIEHEIKQIEGLQNVKPFYAAPRKSYGVANLKD